MVSDMLSQDEIDALLKKNDMDDESDSNAVVSIDGYLSAMEQDALGEIGNITFGSASTAFSTLLNQKVDITTPTISIIEKKLLKDEFPKPHVAIHVKYTEGFEGVNLLVIKAEDAKIIADLMLGGDGKTPEEELNEMHLSAVQEAMNQMMGSASTSMSTVFNKRVDISPPGIDVVDFSEDDKEVILTEEEVLIKVSFRMKIGDLIDSSIMQLLPIAFAKEMVDLLLNPVPDSQEVDQAVAQTSSVPAEETSKNQKPASTSMTKDFVDQQQGVSQQAQQPVYQQQPMYQQPSFNPYSQMVDQRSANVQPVQFSNFDQNPAVQVDTRNLNLLLDIPLQVTVELGRTKRVIKEILELSPGSILELDKLAGEPVDILVNNKLIAKGEVVVIEENFGVRVTDILSQWERLEKLR